MQIDPRDVTALSRIEDACLNASAPPEQRWLDGWLLRFNAGKAKRARCVHALAPGRLPFDERLARVERFYRELGLALYVRITPFTPEGVEAELVARGFGTLDDTRVMHRRELATLRDDALPAGCRLVPVDAERYAQTVGDLRGTPPDQRVAHALRLRGSPVPYCGFELHDAHGSRLGCGQFAVEDDAVGLYDIFIAPAARGRGLARQLCTNLLQQARAGGATQAYLQVEGDNDAARAVYHRLGFADAYAYHYRTPGRA